MLSSAPPPSSYAYVCNHETMPCSCSIMLNCLRAQGSCYIPENLIYSCAYVAVWALTAYPVIKCIRMCLYNNMGLHSVEIVRGFSKITKEEALFIIDPQLCYRCRGSTYS